MTEKANTIEKKALAQVTEQERQHWTGIAFIWIGTMICIPMLMVGAMMISGLTLGSTIVVATVGFAICCTIMSLTGIIGTDLGYPLVMCASKSFGDTGARIVVSLVIAIAQFGWFGVQTATCGFAFCELMNTAFNVVFPFWLSALIWGIVMLTTAVYGFKLMKILNYIAVPALILLCLYGVISAINTKGVGNLFSYQPPQAIPMLSAISIMIGLFAVGAIMSIVAGEYDITKVFASTGHTIISMLVLILATWTTNTGNAYTAGLAVMRLFNIKDDKRPIVTAICGILGTILAMIGVMSYFEQFLYLLAAAVPPIAGVLIADYWFLGRGKKENWSIIPGLNWYGIAAWVAGTVIALYASFFSQALDSIIVSFVVYSVLNLLFGKKELQHKNSEAIEN